MATAKGWAVVDANGINVRTISNTRRAAIVNWLLVDKQIMATRIASDQDIEAAWEQHHGEAYAIEVIITAVVH